MKEKAILQDYFQQLVIDSGLSSVGISQTLKALEMGAASSVLVWDQIQVVSPFFDTLNSFLQNDAFVKTGNATLFSDGVVDFH
jgi:peptide subunit release factor 1 (eRF1)